MHKFESTLIAIPARIGFSRSRHEPSGSLASRVKPPWIWPLSQTLVVFLRQRPNSNPGAAAIPQNKLVKRTAMGSAGDLDANKKKRQPDHRLRGFGCSQSALPQQIPLKDERHNATQGAHYSAGDSWVTAADCFFAGIKKASTSRERAGLLDYQRF